MTDPPSPAPGPGLFGGLTAVTDVIGTAARDTAHHATLAAIHAAGGPGAGFLVDPTRAQAAVRSLEETLRILTETLLGGARLARFTPAGEDHVSRRVADNAIQMTNNAYDYVRVLADQVATVRNALQAQLDAYRSADRDDTIGRT